LHLKAAMPRGDGMTAACFAPETGAEKHEVVGHCTNGGGAKLHRTERDLHQQNGAREPGYPFYFQGQDVSEIDNEIGVETSEGEEERSGQHEVRERGAEKKSGDGGTDHTNEVKEREFECPPRRLEAVAHPPKKKHVEGDVGPIGQRQHARHLRNENISDEAPNFPMHDGGAVEHEQVEISGIHFLEHKDQRSEKTDITQQPWNGEKA